MSDALTRLERKALEVALSGEDTWKQQLRKQIPDLVVIDRSFTGCGFFTKFACEACVPVEDLPPAGHGDRVPTVWARHPEIESDEAVFNVFLENGKITMLEGSSTGTVWPANDQLFRFESEEK